MTEPVEAVEVVEVEDTEPENWKTSNLAVAGKIGDSFFLELEWDKYIWKCGKAL